MRKRKFGALKQMCSSWLALTVLLLFIAIALTGCSGGSGAGGVSTIISGAVVDGFISGATVQAYQINADGSRGALVGGPTISDASGNYTLNLGTYTGPVLIETSGGSHVDWATGTLVNLGAADKLSAVIANAAGNVTSHVTPLTLMAAQQALRDIQINRTSAVTAINNANKKIGDHFGGFNILTDKPIDPNVAGSAAGVPQARVDYTLVLAGISKNAAANGWKPFSLVTAMALDASDGAFDGKQGATQVTVTTSAGSEANLPATAGKSDMGVAIAVFQGSVQNASGAAATAQIINTLKPSTVTTTRDNKGVWFISGSPQDRLYDVFEAMGYAVATDRLWQAETFRRQALGRLAEIFGSTQLAQDRQVRTMSYSDQELENGFASLDAEAQEVINGYVAGFNRRIAEIRQNPSLLPFEFTQVGITGATLEDWTYKHVLAWATLMMRNFDPQALRTGQIDNSALYQGLVAVYGAGNGARMFEDLRWLNDPDALTYIHKPIRVPLAVPTEPAPTPLMLNPPSFPDLREVARRMSETQKEIDENLKKINASVKMGSYAWAIGKSKTASGNPMIYSGPQMGFTVPSIIGEGSIRAGGLNVSGMYIAGLPSIVIGRTPHHAWSMQVGHANTVDYYLEAALPANPHRTEVIKVRGQADVNLPVFRTARGPVVNANPVISWKYSHWGHEFNVIKAYLGLARATSMDQFGAAIEMVPLSQHFTYADRNGNIGYWMSGRDPVRPYGEWRLPQGAAGTPLEWSSANLIPRSTDRNTARGYYGGWNNKAHAGYINSWNNIGYSFGVFNRAHVIDDYLAATSNLTFDQVRDLALRIAATDSFNSGGNPWKFVSEYFIAAVNTAPDAPVAARTNALALLAQWDGHFVDGGAPSWASGLNRADAWILMDAWIKEVIKLTFEELDAHASLATAKNNQALFNVLLHALRPGGVKNYYDWFKNVTPGTPQTANAIIVKALDNTLAALGPGSWGINKRGVIPFNHTMLLNVHNIPFSSRSTYAHVIEYGAEGPVRLQSMFPLGASGNISVSAGGLPVYDPHFFSMSGKIAAGNDVYDGFAHRNFPLFE